jgi:HEPN domain-containing protein
MPARNIPDTGEPIVRAFHWLRWANSDYLAARYLLLAQMVVQGCVLANTAIEKYLKALHAHVELPIPRSHAVETLYRELKNSRKSTVTLNESFLRVLQKAYRLRYPDALPDGFNISLNQMKVLAELDRTVFVISSAFMFSEGARDSVVTRTMKSGDSRFLEKNVVLNPEQASAFFGSDSQSFEFRTRKPVDINVEYLSPWVTDDGRFDEEGAVLTPGRGINDIRLPFPRGDGVVTHKQMFDWPK